MLARKLILSMLLSLAIAVSLVASNQQAQPPLTQPVTPLLAGQEMFRSYCAQCHGLDGKGHGPAAAALKDAPSNLTLLSEMNSGKFPSEKVESVIEGNQFIPAHGSGDMPVWGQAFRNSNRDPMLTKIKIHNLALYIQSIQK